MLHFICFILTIPTIYCFSLQSFREGLEKADSKDGIKEIYEKEVR